MRYLQAKCKEPCSKQVYHEAAKMCTNEHHLQGPNHQSKEAEDGKEANTGML